jgi:tRNA-splicing ligase RtcB
MSRGEAMRKLDQQKVNEPYRRDGILVNVDGEVPLDESAHCYKSADEVVLAVTSAGLATIEHRLWPICSLKGTEEGASRPAKRAEKARGRARDKARGEERSVVRRNKGGR